MTGRPLPKALWPVLRRGTGSVQFGTDPGRAVVLEGLSPDEIDALLLLDGTRALPAALRTPSGRELLGLLTDHRLVGDLGATPVPPVVRSLATHEVDAALRTATSPRDGYAALADRAVAHLLVSGRGELPRAVADQLRRAGVGSVWQGAEAADDWEQSASDHHRAHRHPRPRGAERPSPHPPALVVVVGGGAVDAAAGAPWRARGIPVLPVVLHGVEAAVGPVVVPGGPCLRCLDLARADLDPAWPAVLGQLLPVAVGAGPEVNGPASLVALTAALAALVAVSVLDGSALPGGRSLEVGLPWPVVRQRQWDVHPRCSCSPRTARSRRPADGDGSAQARMAG